jgi:hypothetical protein
VSERQEDAEANAGHAETDEEEQKRGERRSHAETAQKPPCFQDAQLLQPLQTPQGNTHIYIYIYIDIAYIYTHTHTFI